MNCNYLIKELQPLAEIKAWISVYCQNNTQHPIYLELTKVDPIKKLIYGYSHDNWGNRLFVIDANQITGYAVEDFYVEKLAKHDKS